MVFKFRGRPIRKYMVYDFMHKTSVTILASTAVIGFFSLTANIVYNVFFNPARPGDRRKVIEQQILEAHKKKELEYNKAREAMKQSREGTGQ